MYKVVSFEYDDGYHVVDERNFDDIVQSINFASLNGRCYVILKEYRKEYDIYYFCLVARSSYESWSPLK